MRDGGASLDRSSFSGTLSDDNGEESPADLTINKRNRHKAHIYIHTHTISHQVVWVTMEDLVDMNAR